MNIGTARAKLAQLGYRLRQRGRGFLIHDGRGIPLHETHMTPYSQTFEDVVWWVEEICEEVEAVR